MIIEAVGNPYPNKVWTQKWHWTKSTHLRRQISKREMFQSWCLNSLAVAQVEQIAPWWSSIGNHQRSLSPWIKENQIQCKFSWKSKIHNKTLTVVSSCIKMTKVWKKLGKKHSKIGLGLRLAWAKKDPQAFYRTSKNATIRACRPLLKNHLAKKYQSKKNLTVNLPKKKSTNLSQFFNFLKILTWCGKSLERCILRWVSINPISEG
jgi:hypothetical protein